MEETEQSSNNKIAASVAQIYNHVQNQREKQKASQLQEYLKTGRDQVLAQMTTSHCSPPAAASSSSNATTTVVPLQMTTYSSLQEEPGIRRGLKFTSHYKGKYSTVHVPSHNLNPVEQRIPKHFVYAPVRQLLYVPDEKTKYLPHLADGKDLAQFFSKEDIAYREKLIKYGPAFRMDEKNEIIDTCLKECARTLTNGNDSYVVWDDVAMTDLIVTTLADKMELDGDYVQERLTKLRGTQEKTNPTVGEESVEDDEDKSTDSEYDEVEKSYLEAQDSYRACFCQRCYSFCCNIHGPVLGKPSLSTQMKRAELIESSGTWKSLGRNIASLPDNQFDDIVELSSFHKTICKRMFIMFDGDLDEMSNAMRAPKHLLASYIQEQKFQLPPKAKIPPDAAKKKIGVPYYSVKNYNRKWYKGIEEAKIHPLFTPCTHKRMCSEKSCHCVMNHLFCTNACSWGSLSPNFFRGCGCKGACKLNCSCALANRECDPDLCSCGPCCDPPGRPAVRQQCRNDNIRMHRNQHLLIGPSTVKGAGWGLFTRHDVKKGEFLLEYVGEVITQTEGERRGEIDDARDRTYLFNLCSDFAIDASRRGNKARFINHSDTPNCETKMLFVNGEQRIGFFAKEHIEAQSELFFDYNLNEALENHLISKSGKTFPWMKPAHDKKPAARPAKRAKKDR